MKWMIAETHSLDDVLMALAKGRAVFALTDDEQGRYRLEPAPVWQSDRHTLGAFRPTEPLKSLFFPAREFLGPLSDDGPARDQDGERIVFGVKNCDLSALTIFDHVFLNGGCPDPYYAEAREKTVLVSSDCTGFLDVCFCPAVGEQPFAQTGFDINIAPTPSGYLIESGSERGTAILQDAELYLQPAGPELLAAVKEQRAAKYRELADHGAAHGLNPGLDLRAAVEGAFESDMWRQIAADCVECGACNFICCTCHCFLLADGVDADGKAARTKQWDACLLKNFAAAAGGHNPRALRAERLRNRFDKKFSYFPEVLGRYACDGCGRCSEACIAKIDIRDVLRRAADEAGTLHTYTGDD